MVYTVIVYSIPEGGVFVKVVRAPNATQAFARAVEMRFPGAQAKDFELIACIQGIAGFVAPDESVRLFPSA